MSRASENPPLAGSASHHQRKEDGGLELILRRVLEREARRARCEGMQPQTEEELFMHEGFCSWLRDSTTYPPLGPWPFSEASLRHLLGTRAEFADDTVEGVEPEAEASSLPR